MFCPRCGTKLLLLAEGRFYPSEPDESLVKELVKKSEKWKKLWEETMKEARWGSKSIDVEFLVCVPCKRLLMSYGRRGFYFDILGTLTDEAVATMVADKLKGEK